MRFLNYQRFLQMSISLHLKNNLYLEDIVDCYNENDMDLIINSDIVLNRVVRPPHCGLKYVLRGDGTGANRYGIDGFAFKKKCNPFKGTMFKIGKPWWDYVLPFHFINSGLSLYCTKNIAEHEEHERNWDENDWLDYAKQFVKLYGVSCEEDFSKFAMGAIELIEKHTIYECGRIND